MTTTFQDPDIECRNEYDSFKDVFYKGQPYTGTVQDGLETIEYREGVIHGRHTVYFKNGNLQCEEVYDHGEVVFSKWYYENGNIESETKDNSFKRWNERGDLIQKDREHYHLNGNLRILYADQNDDFSIKYFALDGELIYTQKKDIWINDHYERVIDYDNDLMNRWHSELLNKITNGDAENHRVHHIWMWYWKIFDKDQKEYFEIVNQLLTHSNDEVTQTIARIIASHKFHPYIQQENEKNSKTYELIRKFTKYQDENFPNRETKKVNL